MLEEGGTSFFFCLVMLINEMTDDIRLQDPSERCVVDSISTNCDALKCDGIRLHLHGRIDLTVNCDAKEAQPTDRPPIAPSVTVVGKLLPLFFLHQQLAFIYLGETTSQLIQPF